MERARDILPSLLGESDEELAVAYWSAAAGEWLAARTRATGLYGGGLIVEVESPRWQAELEELSGRLIGRLNQMVGRPVVKRLLFRLATKKPPQRAGSASSERAAGAER